MPALNRDVVDRILQINAAHRQLPSSHSNNPVELRAQRGPIADRVGPAGAVWMTRTGADHKMFPPFWIPCHKRNARPLAVSPYAFEHGDRCSRGTERCRAARCAQGYE